MKVKTTVKAGAPAAAEKYCYLADPVLGITYCCQVINGERVCYVAEPITGLV